MSVSLKNLSKHDTQPRKIMELGTHHFYILQCVTCWGYGIGFRVDVWHIAPVLYCITRSAGGTVGIAEDEAKYASGIDHGLEVIDLRAVRWIPGAVEWSTVLLDTQERGGRPKEGKVNEVQCRPKSDEKQESSGVC